MIKVFHIIKSLGRGGAETLIPESIKLHDRSRFKFKTGYFLPRKNQLVEEITNAGAEVLCINKSSNWQILKSTDKVSETVTTNNVHVIHAHLPWAGILARKVGKKTRIPVIYTEHNKQERYHPLTRWMNKYTFNQNDMVIAVSDDVKDSIQKSIKPKVEVRTILNGVNTNKFDPGKYDKFKERQSLGIPEDSLVIGTVAVFRAQKRLTQWVELVTRIKQKIPNAFFVMLGDGPEEEKIKGRISIRQLNDCTILPGRLEEVRPWLATMDIYMMTSEFEGLPIALLEAMSMELPVVSTDAGGIKEVIREGKEGFIKPVNQPMELEEPLLKLVENKALRVKMGKKGRERVKKVFSLERMVRELEEAYVDVLAKKGKSPV